MNIFLDLNQPLLHGSNYSSQLAVLHTHYELTIQHM